MNNPLNAHPARGCEAEWKHTRQPYPNHSRSWIFLLIYVIQDVVSCLFRLTPHGHVTPHGVPTGVHVKKNINPTGACKGNGAMAPGLVFLRKLQVPCAFFSGALQLLVEVRIHLDLA